MTPKAGKGTGMVAKAEELCKKHGWFLCRQFENEANPAFHAQTTGPEILIDFAGKRLDYFVTGYGTGGTFQARGLLRTSTRPTLNLPRYPHVCTNIQPEGALHIHVGDLLPLRDLSLFLSQLVLEA